VKFLRNCHEAAEAAAAPKELLLRDSLRFFSGFSLTLADFHVVF
jgi:hypothetical protein